MKYTGIARRVDELGRVVLPRELRRTMGIEVGDPLDIYVSEDMVCLKKTPEKECAVCGTEEGLEDICGIYLCKKCGYKIADKFMEA